MLWILSVAGLALLQMHNQYPKLDANSVDAPEDKIEEAAAFYPFAEAAYTVCDIFFFFYVLLFSLFQWTQILPISYAGSITGCW